MKVEYPAKVADEVMKHVFVLGWPRSGKTAMMRHLEGTHKRKLIRLDELVDWNRDNQTDGFRKYEKFLAER